MLSIQQSPQPSCEKGKAKNAHINIMKSDHDQKIWYQKYSKPGKKSFYKSTKLQALLHISFFI